MEWFYLALLAPFVLVPVVLLFGYAGCGAFDAKAELHLTPTVDGTTVTLTWTAGPMGTVRYRISRGEEGGEMEVLQTVASSQTQYVDTGRTELVTYFYKVVALNGADENVAESQEQDKATIPLLTPSNLKAVSTEPNKVRLTWTNRAESKINRNVIRRNRIGTADFAEMELARAEAHEDITPSATTDFTFQIAGRLNEPGTSTTSAFVPTTPVNVESTSPPPPPPEDPVLVFPETPITTPIRNSSNAGDCVIQRFPKEQLLTGGNKVRVTFRPAPGGLGFKIVTISQPARSGDGFDSHTDLKTIDTNFNLSATQRTTRDVDYVLDPDHDLLIAFDIKDDAGEVPIVDGVTGCTVYQQDNTAQAGRMDRSGFLTFINTLLIVEKIEVL